MSVKDIAQRFRDGRHTEADVNAVLNALKNGDGVFLRDAVASYIKYADRVDESALIRYLKIAKDSWPAHEIISGLSNLRCKDEEFLVEVMRYARGVAWDEEGYAQLAAVAAIPRIAVGASGVRETLRTAIKSKNVVVRETVLDASLKLLGIPALEYKAGLSDIGVARDIPQAIHDWLDSKPN